MEKHAFVHDAKATLASETKPLVGSAFQRREGNLSTTQTGFTFKQVIHAAKSFIHVSPLEHPPRLKEGRPRHRFLSHKPDAAPVSPVPPAAPAAVQDLLHLIHLFHLINLIHLMHLLSFSLYRHGGVPPGSVFGPGRLRSTFRLRTTKTSFFLLLMEPSDVKRMKARLGSGSVRCPRFFTDLYGENGVWQVLVADLHGRGGSFGVRPRISDHSAQHLANAGHLEGTRVQF